MSADEPTPDAWTIGRLLTWTTDYLREKGADSPRLDAEVLLSHARGCQRIELYTAFEEEADEPLRQAFRALVQRRAAGTPVAYLVGHRDFFSLSFQVTPDVLIPRPETEMLVVRTLDLAKEMGGTTEPLRIADVGTGSGALAVSILKHLSASTATAIDISPAALEVASKNAERLQVAERIEFLCSDLFVAYTGPPLDLVVSNPPYVASDEMPELPVEVRAHEPSLALDGGSHGTAVIERLIPQSAEHIRSGGWLLIEVSPMNAVHVAEIVDQNEQFTLRETLSDLAGHARVVQAERK